MQHLPLSGKPQARARDWLLRGLQLLASVAVLWVLSRDLDAERVRAVLTGGALGWLALGCAIKTSTLVLHEVRLWLAFAKPRPPLSRVLGIGLAAGVLNLVLPARAGDFAAIAMLHKECELPPAKATAAVGLINFLEMAIFGLVVLAVLIAGAPRWELVLGAPAHAQALQVMTIGTLGAIGVAVVLVVVARSLRGGEAPPAGPGPIQLLKDTITSAGTSLSSRGWLAIQSVTALLQATGMVAAFATGIFAAGLDVELPLLAAAGILAISSVAAVVLPPSFGAGPAAASVAVLTVFGVDQTGALLYAAAYWFIANVPAVGLGLPALWQRKMGTPDA